MTQGRTMMRTMRMRGAQGAVQLRAVACCCCGCGCGCGLLLMLWLLLLLMLCCFDEWMAACLTQLAGCVVALHVLMGNLAACCLLLPAAAALQVWPPGEARQWAHRARARALGRARQGPRAAPAGGLPAATDAAAGLWRQRRSCRPLCAGGPAAGQQQAQRVCAPAAAAAARRPAAAVRGRPLCGARRRSG
jgi:hypothetical protein